MSGTHTTASITLPDGVDWADWLRRWDAQQTGYLPYREHRFTAMFGILAELMPAEFVALDLGCGPGSLSQRLLNRFPQAWCIAVDFDPLLLSIGRTVLGNSDGRLRWVELDLEDCPDLASALAIEQVDAVLSTTALHWFTIEKLALLYRQVGQLVRPGGVFLNGDNIKFAPHLNAFQQVADAVKERDKKIAFEEHGVEDWEKWWAAVAAIPGVESLLAERERRFGWRPKGFSAPIVDVHEAALRDAGFHQVGTIWQRFDDRVIMAVK